MSPPKGHNHLCWAVGCKNKVLYRGGVWYTYCDQHLRIHNWGPYRKPARDHHHPEAREVKSPKFPQGYDPASFMLDLRGPKVFLNKRMTTEQAISLVLKRRGLIK